MFWIIIGGAATLTLMIALGLSGAGSLTGYLLVNVPFPFLLAGVVIAVRFVHRRPVRTLITPRARIDARRIAVSFGLFFALAIAASLVEALIDPE